MLEHSRNAKVTYFNLTASGHEDVLSLQVSVKNLPIVDVLDGKGHLDEPVENLIFIVAN